MCLTCMDHVLATRAGSARLRQHRADRLPAVVAERIEAFIALKEEIRGLKRALKLASSRVNILGKVK